MRNLAVLTARLSGRPLLMRQEDAHAWASRLLSLDPSREDRPKGLMSWLSRARSMRTAELKPEDIAAARTGCSMPLWMGDPDDAGFGWVLKDNVAVVSVDGPLLDEGYVSEWSDWMIPGYDTLSQTFAEVQADPRVGGSFFRINSPGGMATQGLPDFCSQLLQAKTASGGDKPIFAYATAAYSAAYWIFASCDRGYASEMGGVGSIGAVCMHCDMSGGLAQDGIVMTAIQFGAHKTDGSPYTALSDGARASLQSEIDFIGNKFVDGVIAGRPNLSRDAVLATEAACYYAGNTDQSRSGLALGLVDEIASEQAAFAALQAAIATRSPVTPRLTSIGPAVFVPKAPETKMATKKAATRENPVTEPSDGMEICETCNGTGESDGTDCPVCDGEGEVEIADDKKVAQTPPKPPAAEASVAEAIAKSAEAKAHPQQALAAIASGLTFAQFAAMAGVVDSSSTETALDRRMRGASRLRSDGPPQDAGKSVLGSALVANAKAKRDSAESAKAK